MHDTRSKTVILADGNFPTHPVPLALLQGAHRVVCCDGAAVKLLDAGREPDWIVGDLDSLPASLRTRYTARLVVDPCQGQRLTKAIRFCKAQAGTTGSSWGLPVCARITRWAISRCSSSTRTTPPGHRW